jgi:hypothetical protein
MQYLLMIYQNEAEYAKMDAAAQARRCLRNISAFTQVHRPERQFQGR